MHDLKINFDKIIPIVKKTLADQLRVDGNLQAYPNPPGIPDLTLSLLQEALSIDSEHCFWGVAGRLRAGLPGAAPPEQL